MKAVRIIIGTKNYIPLRTGIENEVSSLMYEWRALNRNDVKVEDGDNKLQVLVTFCDMEYKCTYEALSPLSLIQHDIHQYNVLTLVLLHIIIQ